MSAVATPKGIGKKLPLSRPVPRKWVACSVTAGAVAAIALGWSVYAVMVDAPMADVVAVELGGHDQSADWPVWLPGALRWDFAFIAGYGIALLAATFFIASWVARTVRAEKVVLAGRIAAVTVIVADCLENTLLLIVGGHPSWDSAWRHLMLDAASVFAVLKFSAFLVAGVVSVAAIVLLLARSIVNRNARLDEWKKEITYTPPAPVERDDPEAADGEHGTHVRWRNGFRLPAGSEFGVNDVGVCLSGGGVRAGTVALGALQELRDELLGARHLVSVSGGGYTAGAFAQALTTMDPPPTGPDPAGVVQRDGHVVLTSGSVEEDHIRRHSAYLANTLPELAVALGLILRHFLLSVLVLFAPAVVAGVLAGWFYKYIPIADLSELNARQESTSFGTPFNTFRVPALVALGLVAVVALGLWLLHFWAIDHAIQRSAWLGRASTCTAWFAGVVAVVTVVLPVLASTAAWFLSLGRGVGHVAVASSVGGLLITYASTIAAIGWRNRTTISKGLSAVGGKGSTTVAIPTSLMQRLLVGLTLVLLGAGWLLLLGSMMLTRGDTAALWTAFGIGIGLVYLGGVADETTLSLHPFYRKRLALAFAVRAVRRQGDERVIAVAYDPSEMTTLSKYGQVGGFPKLVFAATANLTGEDRTPPGRNAVSYTFSADAVGGPDVGWISTADLERLATPRLTRDLTVQGAVALSGAAFASAMGRGARWFQILLAISGARLGAWLPNPRFVNEAHEHAGRGDWCYPYLPSTRRMSYLLKEIFDIHPHEDRLLQVTDGGHYENLGLVELLRRRCRRIYCIDASGDSPPTATTLAQAIALAQDELGVRIDLDTTPFDSEPGIGKAIEPKDPLSGLNARLSKTTVISGTITYPHESGLQPEPNGKPPTGRLIVAKTLLTNDMPYWLLSYAAKHPEFPHDSTGDQWFNADQFGAYAELGRQLGKRIRKASGPLVQTTAPARVDEVTLHVHVTDGDHDANASVPVPGLQHGTNLDVDIHLANGST